MSLAERLARAQTERVARVRGVEVADLLPPVAEPVPEVVEPEPAGPGRNCTGCGAEGNIDLVDTFRGVAYLSCVRCGTRWESMRLELAPRPVEQPRFRD